jgi:hypothetical protein
VADKKKADLMLLLGAPSKSDAGAEEDYDGDLEVAADDLIAAVQGGDAAGVAAAFKAMHELCAMRG